MSAVPKGTLGDEMKSIIRDLKEIVAKDLDVNRTFDEVDELAPLLEEGLALDSITLVDFTSLIEEHFGIEFEDKDLRPETFENLTVLASFIAARQCGQGVS